MFMLCQGQAKLSIDQIAIWRLVCRLGYPRYAIIYAEAAHQRDSEVACPEDVGWMDMDTATVIEVSEEQK